MTHEEASKIVTHHLGAAQNGFGQTRKGWTVGAILPGCAASISVTAPTVAEAAADCAAQLRAAGWVPTHPRLEWSDNRLYLHMDRTHFVVATYLLPACDVLFHPDFSEWRRCNDVPALAAAIAEWCATNLPSLHLPLPPFPETPDAS